jgi:hypothetical protein
MKKVLLFTAIGIGLAAVAYAQGDKSGGGKKAKLSGGGWHSSGLTGADENIGSGGGIVGNGFTEESSAGSSGGGLHKGGHSGNGFEGSAGTRGGFIDSGNGASNGFIGEKIGNGFTEDSGGILRGSVRAFEGSSGEGGFTNEGGTNAGGFTDGGGGVKNG